jgi:uncharacterized protein
VEVAVATVSAIGIAPLKGARLVHPDDVMVGAGGVAADRRFVLMDQRGRIATSLKHPALLRVTATYDRGADPGGRLVVMFPDGTEVCGRVEDGEPVVPSLWRRRRPGRVVTGPWASALSDVLGQPVRLVRLTEPLAGSDAEPVSLVSEASVRRLEVEAGRRIDPRRFRMLFTLSGCDPFEEESWIGSRLRIGQAEIEVTTATGRCAVTTQDPETGTRDLDTLDAIARARGSRAGQGVDCGVYALVVRAGRVRVGDNVVVSGR